jgi:hypothetical protein
VGCDFWGLLVWNFWGFAKFEAWSLRDLKFEILQEI